jgi:hypothetical protein
MAEQHLDHADVHLLFKEVRRETVTQRVHRHTLVDVRGFGGGMNGAVQLPRAQLIEWIEPGKQPPTLGEVSEILCAEASIKKSQLMAQVKRSPKRMAN